MVFNGVSIIIEGVFDIGSYNLKSIFDQQELDYDTETILRREISSSGKSRAFINDSPVNLGQLSAIGSKIIDIHSQYQNLEILEDEKLIQNAKERGSQLFERLSDIKDRSNIIGDNRGIGLLQGLEIVKDKKTKERFNPKKYVNMLLTEKLKQRGIWIRVPAYILPVAPPLTSTKDQIDQICDAIDSSLIELEKEII